jgi:hypothetical protein
LYHNKHLFGCQAHFDNFFPSGDAPSFSTQNSLDGRKILKKRDIAFWPEMAYDKDTTALLN